MLGVMQRHDDCNVIITGDFNVDLDSAGNVARFVSAISQRYSLLRYDKLFLSEYRPMHICKLCFKSAKSY